MTALDGETAGGGTATSGRRCALIGSEPLLIECAAMLLERGHAVAGIVTDRPAIRDWGAARGIRVLDDMAGLKGAGIGKLDWLFSITNLRIVPADILALPTCAAINFHDGPLPAYAGLNTPVWALLNGEGRHGVTWHLMENQVDTGGVLAARSFDIDPGETALSLNTKCFAAAIESFADLIDDLAAHPVPAAARAGTPVRYYGREHRPPACATIRWSDDAEAIVSFVRALDHGGHANPLGSPKLRIGDDIVLVAAATVGRAGTGATPGTVTGADSDRISVATATNEVILTRLLTANGEPLACADAVALGLREGVDLSCGNDAMTLSALDAAVARHEPWWRRRLAARDPLTLPLVDRLPSGADPGVERTDSAVPEGVSAATATAVLLALFGRIADKAAFDVGYSDPVFAARFDGLEPWFARQVPLAAAIEFDRGLGDLREATAAQVRELHRRIGHSADLLARSPELRGLPADLPVAIVVVDRLDDARPSAGAELTVAVRSDGGAVRWITGGGVDAALVATLRGSFAAMLAAALVDPDRPIGILPLLGEEERGRVVAAENGPVVAVEDARCIHATFEDQARRTPDAPAVTARGATLSFRELDDRANRLARHLRSMGVGPDRLVGLHLERSVDMLVALIAIHKAGGAYVPLDPAYPPDRVAHMIRDSRATVIVTQGSLAERLPAGDAAIVALDAEAARIAALSADPVDGGATPADLAYVIYTSGSTGLPKGVMVEHAQVANFFAGMDRVIEPGGAWLAVTSLSFDISVLELCWTVTRGRHVVIATGDELTGPAPAPARPVAFSLFYFASADGGEASDRYRLLLDGARFADTHGFAAVWTPERHFHAFGGLYPNPSVTSAAVAAVTSRVAIRGGSVVMPLHHPARVAEEWSLVDNLSNGRVGIAFASGWQPNDFVLRPEAFADKSAALMSGMDAVRGLWRGEARSFPGPLGAPVEVRIYPRPVQPELPFWITTAGNPDTFAAAGRAGASVLTHLLGQTTDELAAKIAVYRAARRQAGHPGEGHVTLMLHSFVGEDEAAVRETVRGPLTEYLRTSTNLVKEFAWSFPAFKRRPGMADAGAAPDLSTLDEEEMAGLLDHAFERYFETGGLFGTPERCLRTVELVAAAGVDEIGCLIDFGVPAQVVLDGLPALDALRRLAAARADAAGETLGGLMARHGVTHLQCTPSMARMLLTDEDARAGLAGLRQLLIGGETFPPELAAELSALVGGSVINMYGPTETTIWSACHVLTGEPGRVPLGRPLANQQIHILDSRGQLVPPGVPGELVIGGDGVVRGYHDRPELTAERFVAHPFTPGTRAYRTGDLARQRSDGVLEFLGRLDHQVKIRGHRIELGEIEAVLGGHPGVERAIVAAREDDPGDVRLVAYYVAAGDPPTPPAELRTHLAARLPDFMIPAHLLALASLPRTPNGKVDRAALPRPEGVAIVVDHAPFVAPGEGMEELIAAVWRDVLKLPSVGVRDNFFDLGGHSLLAVQLHRRLREAIGRALPLTDIFRFPTIAALAAHLATPGEDGAAAAQGTARAAGRRAALQRRFGLRAPAMAEDA
jgi:natural product biosynthesis luciferase-like monooxygenase protein